MDIPYNIFPYPFGFTCTEDEAHMSCRKLKKSIGNKRNGLSSPVKATATYGNNFWEPQESSAHGIWSIRYNLSPRPPVIRLSLCNDLFLKCDCREDLQVPSSPYFPTYAQGQGPPPMVAERFQSVISQLFQYVGRFLLF